MWCDLIGDVEALVMNHEPNTVRLFTTDVGDGDVSRSHRATLRTGLLPARVVALRPPLVDGFRRLRAGGVSEGVEGTGEGGGEDKEYLEAEELALR